LKERGAASVSARSLFAHRQPARPVCEQDMKRAGLVFIYLDLAQTRDAA
jgi:hypothetical protein